MKRIAAAILAGVMIASPAAAETRLNFQAAEGEGATIRFNQGVQTVDIRREHGAVQVTPLGLDHNRLTFAVSVLNLGPQSDNFGIEDMHASIGGQDVPVLTRERLDHLARRRATWAAIAVGVAAGLGAAAAANQRDYYRATTFTPHGTYRTYISTPSTGGQIAAAGMIAGGAYTINNIQNQLDATRAALANEIVQTTTVDPNDSYAGRIVIEQPASRLRNWPQQVHVAVHFNGEDYPFSFQVTRAH